MNSATHTKAYHQETREGGVRTHPVVKTMVIPRQDITDTSTYYQICASQKCAASEMKKQAPVCEEVLEHCRKDQINEVHSELHTVFKKSQINYSVGIEQGLHQHRSSLKQVHDELVRHSSYNKKEMMEAVLSEQRRRTSIMVNHLGETANNEMQHMQETNRKLFRLHEQMKEMFRKKEEAEREKQAIETERSEERMEMVLQQLRRHSAAHQIQAALDVETKEQTNSFKTRAVNDVYFQEQDKKLIQVQLQLLALYQKEEGDLIEREREDMEMTKYRKSLVEEDLLRYCNRVQVNRLLDEEEESNTNNSSDNSVDNETHYRRLSVVHSELITKRKQM